MHNRMHVLILSGFPLECDEVELIFALNSSFRSYTTRWFLNWGGVMVELSRAGL